MTQPQLPLRLTDVPLIVEDPLTEAKQLGGACGVAGHRSDTHGRGTAF